MKKKLIFLIALIGISASLVTAATIESVELEEDMVYEQDDELTIIAEVVDEESVDITIRTAEETIVVDGEPMEEVENNTYEYNHLIEEDIGGDWLAEVNATGNETSIESTQFHVATDEPIFKRQGETPSLPGLGDNVTIEADISHIDEELQNTTLEIYDEEIEMTQVDEERNLLKFSEEITANETEVNEYSITATDQNGDTTTIENEFYVYEDDEDIDITIDIAPTCSSSLDFFLLPGDGEIVQNRTGTFVQIFSNTGNVQSNITVDYLDVTQEGDEEWSPGEDIGPVVQEYDGERFENVFVGATVTYFELFLANEDIANYTARSSVTTDCVADGPQDEIEDDDELEEEYECNDDTDSDQYSCYNQTVFNTELVTVETTTENITEETDLTVDEQRDNTTAYTGQATLNSTDYDVYTFNATNTLNYDYGCITPEGEEVQEEEECTYEGSLIREHMIEVQEIDDETGQEVSLGFQEESEDLLNTSLACSSIDENSSRCNYTFSFVESFDFFGNFEIVDALGEDDDGEGEDTEPQEGDDPDEPGETPEPEPEPVPQPVPEPEPEPELSIRLDALNESVQTRQQQFVPATFEVENAGNTNMTNVTVEPEQLSDEWEVQSAEIASLDVGETTTREVFVQPSLDTNVGRYTIPTTANFDGRELALDYFEVEVQPADLITELRIQETAQSIQIPAETEQTIPILIENTGEQNLTGIEARLQNIDSCGVDSSTEIEQLMEDEQGEIQLNIEAGDTTETCSTTMIIASNEGAYAFSELEVTVIPEEALIPEEQRVPLIAILWTMALVAYAVSTRKYDLDSLTVKAPYLFLIVGEIVIILYIAAVFYDLPIQGILPF